MPKSYPLPEPGIATEATRRANAAHAAALPLDDTGDFEKARRGLIQPAMSLSWRAVDAFSCNPARRRRPVNPHLIR